MPSEWKQDAIRHKYDPLPEDAPRHRKKARKRHAKSDHRHEYEDVAVRTISRSFDGCGTRERYHKAKRCRLCGKLYTVSISPVWGKGELPPRGMRVFKHESDDMWTLYKMRYLPDEMEVSE